MFDQLIQGFENLPEDLDQYLLATEKRFNNVTANTEKSIIWHSQSNRKTPYSLVYIHGYSATRQEVSPLVENLAKRFSANVFFTRLCGHGRDGAAMTEITLENLCSDLVEAYRIAERIGERIIFIANSTGAPLVTWLATKLQGNELHALIYMSPNFGLKNRVTELLTYPFARQILPIFFGKNYEFEPSGELQKKFWTTRFPTIALVPMMEAVKMIRHSDLKNVRQALLILYAEEDSLLDIRAIKSTFKRFGSKQKSIQVIEGTQGKSHHVLAGRIQSPATTGVVEQKIVDFLEAIRL